MEKVFVFLTGSSLVFGEFAPPYHFETDGLSLSLELSEGHYRYLRDLAGARVEKAISAGLTRLLVHPVEPFYTGSDTPRYLELEFPALVVEPGATETVFLTFPVEVGVFVEGIRSTEIIDAFSLVRPKFSLYGTPRHGIITRFARSGRHREIPPVDGAREGVLKLALRNSLSEWVSISRVVIPESEIQLYASGFAGMMAMMRVTGRDKAEIWGVDRPLVGGMSRAHDFFTARRILRLDTAPRLPGMERKGFLMEGGLS
ncbi:MAG: DUF432 domain-containing protein [Methanomicrobiales archaeon]|nr:DUF432 domain-containing protein [Methanomicrobiales archaeon]